MPNITVALLAYKESENLKILLPLIKENLNAINVDYEIEVIDTKEPLDDTEDVCKEFNVIYRNQEYPGFGGAFKTAIQYAKGDLFLILDSDGSHNPIYIPDMYKMYIEEQCDLVIGSRYISGGKTLDSMSSVCMSKLLNTVFRLCLGIKAKDISTDYRLYNTQQLKQINLENENYDVLQEVLLKLKLNNKNFKIMETPITFEKRMYGESKRKLLLFIVSYIKSLIKLLMIRFSWIKNFVLYGFIGILGALVDFLIFSGCSSQGVPPEWSNIMGACFGFLLTFFLNSFFNFKKTTSLVKRFVSYGTICIIGMLISTVSISILKAYCNIYFAKIILLIFVSMLQFVLNKHITFSK